MKETLKRQISEGNEATNDARGKDRRGQSAWIRHRAASRPLRFDNEEIEL
jgi:hypothetical protein